MTPKGKARTNLINRLRELFRRHVSHPIAWVIGQANPILRGWVNYFRVGESSDRDSVSSPRHVKRSMWFSHTTLT